jgi:small GTP-binding protein
MTLKTVFVGDTGVGKTCIIDYALHGTFHSTSFATIGATNATLTVECSVGGIGTPVTFNIWDTAGQERYRSLTPMYFTGARIAILVFDLAKKDSFLALQAFVDLLQQRAPDDCLRVLVGNKMDLDEREVAEAEAEDYRLRIGADYYFETSAKLGRGITEMFAAIAASPELRAEPLLGDDIVRIAEENDQPAKKKKGCGNC